MSQELSVVKDSDKDFDFVSKKIPINEGELEQYIIAVLQKAEEDYLKSSIKKEKEQTDELKKHIVFFYDRTYYEENVAFVLNRKGTPIQSGNIKYNVLMTKYIKTQNFRIVCSLCKAPLFFAKESNSNFWSFMPEKGNVNARCNACHRKATMLFQTYLEEFDKEVVLRQPKDNNFLSSQSDGNNIANQNNDKQIEIIRHAIKSLKKSSHLVEF